MAARDLGIDSAEMRRRNLIGAGEMPYRLPRLEPGGPADDTECERLSRNLQPHALGAARAGRRGQVLAWTENNLLWQVVYEGLREDKPAREVRWEVEGEG